MAYKYGDITAVIISASMEVHTCIGSGFPEVIYQRALDVELTSREVVHLREVEVPVYYKGVSVGHRRVDFLVDGKITVEIKAITKLEDVHLAQALNYLEAFNLEVGMLTNFGGKSLEFKRLINRKFDPLLLKKLNFREGP